MQRTDIASGLGGQVLYVDFTLTYSDLTATATAQSINLQENPGGNAVSPTNFVLPLHGKMLGVYVKHSVAFAGGSISAMTVSVGKTGSNTFFSAAFDVFQAVADTTVQETALFKAGQDSALPITVTFTATGGNVSTATAGSVDIRLFILNASQLPLPNITQVAF